MNDAAAPTPALTTQPHNATLLLAVASRCRKGLTTTADAEALEELARRLSQAHKQIQNQSA